MLIFLIASDINVSTVVRGVSLKLTLRLMPMLKKILLSLGALLLVLIVLGYLNRQTLMLFVFASQISPESPFTPANAPTPPVYASDAAWASLPGKLAAASSAPAGLKTNLGASKVDVFFVHPTSYSSKDNWNQPLDDKSANWVVDERILRHQASVFNRCCDIYAPRYRQATFFSFMDRDGNGAQALDLAYADIVNAFDAFNQRRNKKGDRRPFIVAGHSQGTKHVTRLIAQEIVGTALEANFIVGYLIGFSIEQGDAGLVTCATANDTGCVVGWNSVDGDGDGIFAEAQELICTNPLSWLNDSAYVGHEFNVGSIGFPSYGQAREGEDFTLMPLEVGVADAQCINRMLSVRELRSDAFPSRMPGSSMHVYDYSLFHMNIRQNVDQRISAFFTSE